jgi:hypothetical protein
MLEKDSTNKIDTLNEVEQLIKILVPVVVLFFGIFGYFSGTVSEEVAEKLLFAGGFAVGITNKR